MSDAYTQAIRYLARREYGTQELIHRLQHKGFSITEAQDALRKCQDLGLQDDERFVAAVCRTRVRQGYGPGRIEQDLKAKGVASALIRRRLDAEAAHWIDRAYAVWQKKFAGQVATSTTEIQKQKQFLWYRGFTTDTISDVFGLIKQGVTQDNPDSL